MKKIFIILLTLITSYLLFSSYVYLNQKRIYQYCLDKPMIGYSLDMIKISQYDCNIFKQNLIDIILRKKNTIGLD